MNNKQTTNKRERATNPKGKTYADKVLGKYERTIRRIVYLQFKGDKGIYSQDCEEIVYEVCHAFWKILESGKFKGKHEEASIIAWIKAIARNKRNDFLRQIIMEKQLRVRKIKQVVDNEPNGSAPVDSDPIKEYEKQEKYKFIERETKYPEIINLHRKGYSTKEIAKRLGLKEEQVKKRIKREITCLKELAKSQGWL